MRQTVIALFLSASIVSFAAGRSDVADAAMRGDKAALKTLLEQHADVNAPQADGATAVHWAVFKSDKEMLDLLLKAGASPKAATEITIAFRVPILLNCSAPEGGVIRTAAINSSGANALRLTPR